MAGKAPNGLYRQFSLKEAIHDRVMALKRGKEGMFNWKRKMSVANIPREFWPINLNNFQGDELAREYVEVYCGRLDEVLKRGIGFCFMGKHGVGKTSLQMIILKRALEKGYSCFYLTLAELFRQIYMGFNYPELLVELQRLLTNTQFLAIGEIGRDYHRKDSKQFMLSEFDFIFRKRRSLCLPTSIDTNMTEEEMEDTYGEALISLFSSVLKVTTVEGEDFRIKIQRKQVNEFFGEDECGLPIKEGEAE